ncbi:hypothetical protein BU17DRAFT_36954, partial [Hysterangium stoloniferum]
HESIVLTLIDGDGYIFKDELLKRGRDGGREAAQILNENILSHVKKGDKKNSQVQVWTYMFFNLRGLQQTLVGSCVCTADEFESFLAGFNQANSRFTISDVHSGKEAADSKIKVYLQTWSRFPQTSKIYFGAGSHDNGYYPTLAELQNNRLLDKVVLLQGYEQIAKEIGSLGLPILPIHNLFRSEKILISPKSQPVKQASTPPSTVSSASGECKPLSYNVAVAAHHPIQNPAPCNLFYLSNCVKGSDCKYAHDYILEAEHYDILRENAKKSPCPAANLDSPCPWGDQCALGHKCPQGPQCYHRKIDKCWFKGSELNHSLISTPPFFSMIFCFGRDDARLNQWCSI